jgi:uncharacterized membrane protein YidH (DUF202 family)
MADDGPPPGPVYGDVTRRTWLAAERTWLAWWRTALGAAAVSVAVGRGLPFVTKGARWPFELLGIGYGVLAIGILVARAVRQQQTARALEEGGYHHLTTSLVVWMTGAALVLAVGTLIIIAANL